MMFYVIFFIAVCAVLLWVTVMQKEAYPFSYYPMYSSPHQVSGVSVYRIAFKKQDGTMTWWESEFYRYPEYVGRKLKQLRTISSGADETDVFLRLEQTRLLISILRIAEGEGVQIGNYKTLCIVERTITTDLKPKDHIIEQIPLENLRNELS